ncbi:MAG: hypothetical protein ACI8WB_003612 [Phenylobacterium sp.]|jgi:hypothetical protein
MNITPGVGVGQAKFGITETDLINLLGKPDIIELEEYIEGAGDWYRELWYSHRNITFTFNEEDGYRLSSISITGSGYLLFDRDIFGLPKQFVSHFIAKKTYEIAKNEDWTWDEENSFECLDHDGLGIMFWFKSGNLSIIECRYLYEPDEETVIWPE